MIVRSRLLALLLCSLGLVSCFEESDLDLKTDSVEEALPEEQIAFICTGETAYSHHLFRDCRGLAACEGEILEIARDEVDDYDRSQLCGFCEEQ